MAESDWAAGMHGTEGSTRAHKAVAHASQNTQAPIKIKPSKVGSLHKALGVPEGQKIPASDLNPKPGDSENMREKKQFAKNARTWNH